MLNHMTADPVFVFLGLFNRVNNKNLQKKEESMSVVEIHLYG